MKKSLNGKNKNCYLNERVITSARPYLKLEESELNDIKTIVQIYFQE